MDDRPRLRARGDYWDCERYRGNSELNDQPLACDHANAARALAEIVRWHANRAQTVAQHARALALEARSIALTVDAERRTGSGRQERLAEAGEMRTRARDELGLVNDGYVLQDQAWRELQTRTGGGLQAAERSYALPQDRSSPGGSGVLARLPGATTGTTAAASTLASDDRVAAAPRALPPVADFGAASAAPGGPPPVSGFGVASTSPERPPTNQPPAAASAPPAPVFPASDGVSAAPARPARTEPVASSTGDAFTTADFIAWMDEVNAAVAEAESHAADALAAAAETGGNWRIHRGNCELAMAYLREAVERVSSLTVGDARPAGVTTVAAGRRAGRQRGRREGHAVHRSRACNPTGAGAPDRRRRQRRDLQNRLRRLDKRGQLHRLGRGIPRCRRPGRGRGDRRQLAHPQGKLRTGHGLSAGSHRARQEPHRRRRPAGRRHPRRRRVHRRTFHLPGLEEARARGRLACDSIVAPAPTSANTGPSGIPGIPARTEPAAATAAPATPTAATEISSADFIAWMNDVNTAVSEGETHADDAEAAAAADGNWRTRLGNCVLAVAYVREAVERVTSLTVGDARPAGVTDAAAESTAEFNLERLEAARVRGQRACDSIPSG